MPYFVWQNERSEVVVTRGCSSAGRAPALQAGGQRFDSAHLHQATEGRKCSVMSNQYSGCAHTICYLKTEERIMMIINEGNSV